MKLFLTLAFLAVALGSATAHPFFGQLFSGFTKGMSEAVNNGLDMVKSGNKLATNAITSGVDTVSQMTSRVMGGGLDMGQNVSNGFFNAAKKMTGKSSSVNTESTAAATTGADASAQTSDNAATTGADASAQTSDNAATTGADASAQTSATAASEVSTDAAANVATSEDAAVQSESPATANV